MSGSWFKRFKEGLSKSRDKLSVPKFWSRPPDPATREELETLLLEANFGVPFTERFLKQCYRSTVFYTEYIITMRQNSKFPFTLVFRIQS